MPKKKTIVKNVGKNEKEIQDTVVFMTAYNIHEVKHHLARFWQKNKRKSILNQFHIAGISHKNVYISPDEKINYAVEYDSLNQVSAIQFDDSFAEISSNNPQLVEEMITTLVLHHSAHALLDTSQLHVSMCFNMDRFLVMFGTKIFQVDPVAFIMNESLIVSFELIDYESSVPLSHEAIYGRSNNYGIQPICKIKYFNNSDFVDDDRKIADIIFQNVFGLLNRLAKGRWEFGDFSFVHTTLVMSNKIDNVNDYFQKVLGAQIDNLRIDNISSTDAYSFYSTEYLGLVTQVRNADFSNILFDCMILESFKLYLLQKMIIDYEVNHKLDDIINNQIYVESLYYPYHVPIITLNMINNLKNTVSFTMYKQAVDFKVKALKIQHDRQSANNGKLMNVLLYVLAMIGSAQTLQVLQTEFGLPFKISFGIVMGIFIILGFIWILREFRK